MKHLVCTLLLLLTSLAATAQREQDFAARFMDENAEGTTLACTTVSPTMLEKMMELPDVEENSQIRNVLAQLKSIRVLTHTDESEGEALYTAAETLAKHNTARYKAYSERNGKKLYVRRRGKITVEMVLLSKTGHHFTLINLTGNMTEDFLQQLLKI